MKVWFIDNFKPDYFKCDGYVHDYMHGSINKQNDLYCKIRSIYIVADISLTPRR